MSGLFFHGGGGLFGFVFPHLGPLSSINAFALNKPHKEEHDGNDQKNVNEAAQRVRRDEAQQPADDQNKCNSV